MSKYCLAEARGAAGGMSQFLNFMVMLRKWYEINLLRFYSNCC